MILRIRDVNGGLYKVTELIVETENYYIAFI